MNYRKKINDISSNFTQIFYIICSMSTILTSGYILLNIFDSFKENAEFQSIDIQLVFIVICCVVCAIRTIIFVDKVDKNNRISLNRIEVIDYSNSNEGRVFVRKVQENKKIDFSLQDEDKTLKIFISDKN